MSQPRSISVIIPAWNEETGIVRAVQSAWDAGADQVLVVDAGSQDQTGERARQAGATVILSPAPGRGTQQAAGARQAAGQLLVFLHADSFFEPGAFACLREATTRDPQHVRWGCFSQRIVDPQWRFRCLEVGNQWRADLGRWVYGDQALWVAADTLAGVGGFPPDPLMEDLILSRRLARIGRPWRCPTLVYTSARKWRREGVVRRTLRNWSLLAQFFAGADTAILAAKYRKSGGISETIPAKGCQTDDWPAKGPSR
jgi:rSAM/selenodomain-associated transferase 2